jgi:hypothetical protein
MRRRGRCPFADGSGRARQGTDALALAETDGDTTGGAADETEDESDMW